MGREDTRYPGPASIYVGSLITGTEAKNEKVAEKGSVMRILPTFYINQTGLLTRTPGSTCRTLCATVALYHVVLP
jgi:hypothetical protein